MYVDGPTHNIHNSNADKLIGSLNLTIQLHAQISFCQLFTRLFNKIFF